MYISGTTAPYSSYPALQTRPAQGGGGDAPAAARNVAEAPQRQLAVRVVEGEVLAGRSGDVSKDNLNRIYHTLRGSLDAGTQQQPAANKSSRYAIQAYLENTSPQREGGSGRFAIIDYLV